ncbi:flagellar protein FlaG [Paenibacillus illinoisensis]|uniref:Flagellar protein flag protein n=1 Tax=Paenibacillus illinoisensis TaxID=59845 RepID=A0A2W0CC60_9BACL|nr:flagellar protein FlaG [Paenibacillus illinoisensis]PYY29574.1 Flagellar protein flag protein [Paenibacillus illinoisensis]
MRINSSADLPLRSNELPIVNQANGVNSIQPDKNESVSKQQLDKLIEDGNKVLQRMDTQLRWSVNKESNQMIVKVMDTQTNEVLREIPPEKYLELVQNLCEQVGLFLDEKK